MAAGTWTVTDVDATPRSSRIVDDGTWIRFIFDYDEGDVDTTVFTRITPAPRISAATGAMTFWGPFLAEPTIDANPTLWLQDDAPRVFSDGAVLIEGARTNAWERFGDLDDPPITHLNAVTLTPNDTTAPDGTTTADLIEMGVGGANTQIRDLMADGLFPNETGVAVSAFFKDPDGENIELLFRDKALSNDFGGAQAMPTDWGRLSQSFTAGSGSGDPLLALYESTDGADFHAWGVQVEPDANFPTSPIYTAGASATRADEGLVIDGADLPTEMLTGGFAFDFWPEFDSADVALHRFVWGSGSDYLQIGTNAVLRADGVSHTISSPTYSAGDKLTFVVDWNGNFAMYVNDVVEGTPVDCSATSWATIAADPTVSFGWDGTGNQINGTMSRFRGL